MEQKEWPQYTWQEIFEHRTDDSLWVYHFDEVFDISEFVGKHPGGRAMLRMFAGCDLTHVLPMYHPLLYDTKILKMLAQYKIGVLKGPPQTPRFKEADENSIDYEFRQELIKYWKSKGWPLTCQLPNGGIKARTTTQYWVEIVGQMVIWALLHCICFYTPESMMPLSLRCVVSMFTGMVRLVLAVQFFHTGCHFGSDFLFGLGYVVFEMMCGLGFISFSTEHMVHHTFTNVLFVDPNAPTSTGPDHFYRLSNYQELKPHQKWQWLYIPMTTLFMSMDAVTGHVERNLYGSRKEIPISPHYLGAKFMILEMIGLIHRLFRDVYLPLFYFDMSLATWLLVFLIHEAALGVYAASIFLLSHFFEETFFPPVLTDPDTGYKVIPYTYCDCMMRCSLDYGSYLSMFLTANLSIHSVHHFMPGMPPNMHLELRPIMEQLSKKYKIPYTKKKDMFEGIVSLFKLHYQRGRSPQVALPKLLKLTAKAD